MTPEIVREVKTKAMTATEIKKAIMRAAHTKKVALVDSKMAHGTHYVGTEIIQAEVKGELRAYLVWRAENDGRVLAIPKVKPHGL